MRACASKPWLTRRLTERRKNLIFFDFDINSKLFSHLTHLFRFCCHCHSWVGQNNPLCSHCLSHFKNQIQLNRFYYRDQFPVSYFLSWTQKNHLINNYIYALKKGFFFDEYLNFSHHILQDRLLRQNNIPNYLFIPCPRASTFQSSISMASPQTDHAHQWSLALETTFQCESKELLQFTQSPSNPHSQKQLSKGERLKRKMELRQASQLSSSTHYIFVDDVLTTGATAWAAYEALNKPKNFEVWVIAYRPLKFS